MTTATRPNAFRLAADVYDPPPWEPEDRPPLEPHQVPPQEAWDTWLLEAGRGAGKTEACARFYTKYMRQHPGHRGRIIAPTFGDAVEACIEGPSGLLSIDPEVRWLPSAPGGSKVVWPNGSEALVLGTPLPRDVDRLRAGGNRHIDWWEEMAANPQLGKAWDQAQLGLRLGAHPISIASTTPRTSTAYKRVRQEAGVVLRHASMFDNPHNPKGWVDKMRARYEGTRLGRQELAGQLLDDVEGALWKMAWIEDRRTLELPHGGWQGAPRMGVDLSDGNEDGDEQAYTISALGQDHDLYVIASEGFRITPYQFAVRCIQAAAANGAVIRLEINHGGAWAKDVFRRAMKDLGVFVGLEVIHATRGKHTRAEPVSALYEPRELDSGIVVPGRVRHFGRFELLEEQMTSWTGAPGEKSPDRLDSLVWSLWDFIGRGFRAEKPGEDKAVPYTEGNRGKDPELVVDGAVPWA
jgi:phage terminase large subunit-like protein